MIKKEKPGTLAVTARLFTGFIQNLPNKKVTLEVKDSVLSIKTDSYEATIYGQPKEDFPIIPRIKKEKEFVLKNLDFVKSLSQVVGNVSLSESRPEISGVYISFSKDIVRFAATDSFRLSEKRLVFPTPFSEEMQVILPAKTVQELIRVFSGKDEDIHIWIHNNQILFECTDIQLMSRLIEGEYPRYQEIIPTSFGTEIVLGKQRFLSEIKIHSFFSGKNNDIKLVV